MRSKVLGGEIKRKQIKKPEFCDDGTFSELTVFASERVPIFKQVSAKKRTAPKQRRKKKEKTRYTN